jgi:1-acyl-sn-glycerol-3-phosphate acyltransferase
VLRTLAALGFLIVFIPVAGLIGFPWTWISGKVDFMYYFALRGAGIALRIAGIKVEVEGLETLKQQSSYIFMSNHVSNVDPPILVRLLPGRTSVLVKKELFRVPILGQAMRKASLVPVDRSNREAAIASIGRAADVLRAGIHMTIFPEGTRSPDGQLLPFKKGPFHLAMDTGVPIVPVTVLNTSPMMPKGRLRICPGTARVVFHSPIDPKLQPDREALSEAVRASIASALPAIEGKQG